MHSKPDEAKICLTTPAGRGSLVPWTRSTLLPLDLVFMIAPGSLAAQQPLAQCVALIVAGFRVGGPAPCMHDAPSPGEPVRFRHPRAPIRRLRPRSRPTRNQPPSFSPPPTHAGVARDHYKHLPDQKTNQTSKIMSAEAPAAAVAAAASSEAPAAAKEAAAPAPIIPEKLRKRASLCKK